MTEQQAIELIERNPTIGRKTSRDDINAIDGYYHLLTGRRIKNKGCASCIQPALNAIRREHGYPAPNKEISRKLSAKRIEMCRACIHRKGISVFITCGKPIAGEVVPEGKLCGCLVYIKAKIKTEQCPLGFWDK